MTAPTTAPATEPAADATLLAMADAPLAIAAGAAAIPAALLDLAFGAALVVFALDFDAADLALAGLAVAGLADVFGSAFGFSDLVALVFFDALFAGALASFERAAIAGPAPVFASRALDFPVLFDAAGFFIAVPQVSVAWFRNAIQP